MFWKLWGREHSFVSRCVMCDVYIVTCIDEVVFVGCVQGHILVYTCL